MPATLSNRSAGHRLVSVAKLQTLIAFLGEKPQSNWWPTEFMTARGLQFLNFNFPRTSLSAALTATAVAARSLHDQRIGEGNTYHLFRLPHGLTQDIHRLVAGDGQIGLRELIPDRDTALAALAALADNDAFQATGPVRVAGLGQFLHQPTLRRMAACYHHAFSNAEQVFPYVTTP